ncbi:protein DDI1 homolog 2 isoform X2 [Nilaparvata lugens]|uniref:protein DDI1 homolog 2 isoform X2 n=1 Tax=Nilaparvata lugens TaxID=108931 RepID=UPI000B97EF43|nr:protein DDI1 homolog 2 isoform X2 [Nilaparvata lugens]
MKVTVSTLNDDIFVLDVSEDLELENFKAFCEIESGFPAPEIVIVHNGKPLIDDKISIKTHGVRDGDVVILQHMSTSSSQANFSAPDNGPLVGLDFSAIQIPGQSPAGGGGRGGGASSSGGGGASSGSPLSSQWSQVNDPAHVRDLFLANPDQYALLKQNNPLLADALASGRLEDFAAMLQQQMAERERRQEQRLRMMNAHPFDTEAQRLIADEIKRKNIEANMEAAMEYNPETFGTVVMLYINCKVNGHKVKAFVDSGAQTTIMSAACAERVNIMRLVDTRWSGYAKGVGVQRILGRVHMVQVQIENDFLTTSFSVLKEQPMDMLLGLDMLKRHQCSIDLERNVLRIGTTGTTTQFLGEQDLPECARLSTIANEDELLASSANQDELLQQAIKDSISTSAGAGATPSTSGPSANVNRLDPANSILPSDKFTETEVKELISLGFTREQVISELRRFNGDKKQATAALFAKSLRF